MRDDGHSEVGHSLPTIRSISARLGEDWITRSGLADAPNGVGQHTEAVLIQVGYSYSWNYMPPAQRRPRFRNKGTRDGYPKQRIRLLTLLSRCAGGLEDAPCTRVTSTWPQASAKETLGWSADSSSTFSFHLRMTHESLGRLSNVGERDATRRWRTDELLVSVETKHEDVSGSVVETPVVAVHGFES